MKIKFQSLRILFVYTVLFGVIYPVLITLIGWMFFESEAGGSLISKNGQLVGSKQIAQKFTDEIYVHPRPSAADFSTVASGASNLSRASQALKDQVTDRENKFREINLLTKNETVPPEMLYASGSGLDPHISPWSAKIQIKRALNSRCRTTDANSGDKLVDTLTQNPIMGFLGEERVNVLELNLALDDQFQNLCENKK